MHVASVITSYIDFLDLKCAVDSSSNDSESLPNTCKLTDSESVLPHVSLDWSVITGLPLAVD